MTISPHPDQSPRVELDHVGMVFQGGAASVDVLDDISLAVHAGESLAIIGPSGSGKSTLLNLIAGLLMIPAMLSIVELATAMPRAGGAYYFLDRSLGPLAGTIGGRGTWVGVTPQTQFTLGGMEAECGMF